MTDATAGAGQAAHSGEGRAMTAAEQAELLAGTPVCNLACHDDDGHPYVVPVWFEHADEGFYFVARARSAWAGYLQRDGRVSLSIVPTAGPGRVIVKGTAEILEE